MKRQVLGPLLLWVAAVTVVAAIASLAIGTAGRQVTAGPVAAPLIRDLAPASFQATPTVSPTPRPRPRPNRSPERRPKPAPRPAPSPSATPAVPVTSTFTTMGGRLRVRCNEALIALKGGYAQPAAGWRVIVRESGPDEVRVVFDSGGRFGLQVVATCVDGGPRFDRVRVVTRSGHRRGDHHRFFSPSLDPMSSDGD